MRINVTVKHIPDVASVVEAVRQQGIPAQVSHPQFGLFTAHPADQIQLGRVERTPGVKDWRLAN